MKNNISAIVIVLACVGFVVWGFSNIYETGGGPVNISYDKINA